MKELQNFFKGLYGPSNRRLRSESDATTRILLAVGRLSNAIRKSPDEVRARICHCTSWTFALANTTGVDVAEAMAAKFPMTCGYCGKIPCGCTDDRSEHTAPDIDQNQVGWSTSQWQDHLSNLYGGANRMKGGSDVLRRLYDEVSEVHEIVCRLGGINLKATFLEVHDDLCGEIADVFAWIIAIADICNINLQDEVERYFRNGCPHCKSNPCSCPHTVPIPGGRALADSKYLPGS